MSRPPDYAYRIGCLCTEGQGALFDRAFSTRVPLTLNGHELLKEVIREARSVGINLPRPESSGPFKLWKLKEPLSVEDTKSESAVQKATNLRDLDDFSQSHQLLDTLEDISAYWRPEELETKNKHVHLVLQFPRLKTQRSTGAKDPSLSQIMQFKKIASLIAISVPLPHKNGADFRQGYLFNPGPSNNNVVPAVQDEMENSATSPKADKDIRKLATEIMRGSLKMRPWPVLSTSENVLKELSKGHHEKFWSKASDSFKQSLGTVQNSDYVSFHLYLSILCLWGTGDDVTESKVHAFLTYIFERNVLELFPGNHLEILSGKSFNWTMILQKPKDMNKPEGEANPSSEYEKWSPQPDFVMLVDSFPFLVFEICSDKHHESDRYRMLLYAASILRTPSAFPPDSESQADRASKDKPIVVACYIRGGVVSVYILYLDDELVGGGDNDPGKRLVKFTRDDYRLSTTQGLFGFTRLLYLLAQYVLERRNKWNVNDPERWAKLITKIDYYIKALRLKTASGTK